MGERVLIVDDHPLVAEALTLAVQQGGKASRVDTACDVAGALEAAREHSAYDLVLLDLMLPDSEGLSGLLQLKAALPGARIAIITSRTSAEMVRSALEHGAVGYVLKSTPFARLAEDCQALLAGDTRFPTLTDEASWEADPIGDRLNDLTAAQKRIFLALRSGEANKQIAYDLDLSEATVKAHLTSIFRKLGVTNRSQAIVLSRRLSGDV